MHQSPKSWKDSANTTNSGPKSTSFQLEEAPFEYCDELFQDVKTASNILVDVSINNSFEVEAKNGENVFAQCHQHLHSINMCVEYQQTIKDEMKKLAKLEHAIYQKTSSHAQRLSQIASTICPDHETEFVTRELDSLADEMGHTAQAHHNNAVTLSCHCNVIQQALDCHHELMRSIHTRNLNKSPANSILRNVGVVAAVSRRIPSPRKTITQAAANTKEGQGGKANQRVPPAGTDQSPPRDCANGAGTETVSGEVGEAKEKERAGMSFLHAYCLFEDIRKPRLVLANRIEYLRTQHISVKQQLQDEDCTITCLREKTQDKNRPWYAQVRLEECLSLKEFLGEHGRQLETQMSEARHALEGFDSQYRDKLADILKVFALHKVGHYGNLKRTLMLMKTIFTQDKSILKLNPSVSDEVLASNLWLPTEEYRLITMDSQPIKDAEDTDKNVQRPSITEGSCDSKPSKKLDCNNVVDVTGDNCFGPVETKNVDIYRSPKSVQTPYQIKTANVPSPEKPARSIEVIDVLTTEESVNVSKGLQQSREGGPEWEHLKDGIPPRSSGEFEDNKLPLSNEPESSRSREQQEVASSLIDMPSTSPKRVRRLKKDPSDMTGISPLRSILITPPSNLAIERNEKTVHSSGSLDSLNSDTQDGDEGDKSSSVDGPTYRPRASPRPLVSRRKSRGIAVTRQNFCPGKSLEVRENLSSSVDFTNNHEQAMLNKYISSEIASSHEELTARDVRQSYRQKSKERLSNLSDDKQSVMNRLEREFDKEDSDLKARRYIGKYVTKQRREPLIGRDQVKNKYPFMNSEFFNNKNSNSQWILNGINWGGEGHVGRKAGNFAENLHSWRNSKDKGLRLQNPEEIFSRSDFNESSSKMQTQKRGDNMVINYNMKNNNAKMARDLCLSDSFIVSYPTDKCVLWTSEEYEGESEALTDAGDKNKQEDGDIKRSRDIDIIYTPVTEASNQSTESETQKDSIQCGFTQKAKGAASTNCRRSSSSLEVTPMEQSARSESYAPSDDDSEWETESVSTLTSVSLSSCRPPSQRSRPLVPARTKVNDLALGSRNSQKSTRNICRNPNAKVVKKVWFDDKVYYDNIVPR